MNLIRADHNSFFFFFKISNNLHAFCDRYSVDGLIKFVISAAQSQKTKKKKRIFNSTVYLDPPTTV